MCNWPKYKVPTILVLSISISISSVRLNPLYAMCGYIQIANFALNANYHTRISAILYHLLSAGKVR